MLGLELPIIQAPMAGGATTVELVVAVSEAGGLGSLAAGLLSPKQIKTEIARIKAQTAKPFAVNLMVLSPEQCRNYTHEIPTWLSNLYIQQHIEPKLPAQPAPDFQSQFQILLENPVPIASFTFNCLTHEQINALHQVGTKVIGTANHPLEVEAWAAIGADAICVQGKEAGGHRGGWLTVSDKPLPLLPLILQSKRITNIPLIAAGGLMNANDIKAAFKAGAQLAQLGTAFLTTHEAGISPVYKQALLHAGQTPTRLTRLFSGKWARGLENHFLTTYESYEHTELPPYPQLNAMTTHLRQQAALRGDTQYLSLWAGEGVREVKSESVAALMQRLRATL